MDRVSSKNCSGGARSLLKGQGFLCEHAPAGASSLLKAEALLQPTCPSGAVYSAPSGAQALIRRTFLTKIPHRWCGVLFPGVSPAKIPHRWCGVLRLPLLQRCFNSDTVSFFRGYLLHRCLIFGSSRMHLSPGHIPFKDSIPPV